MKTRRIDNARLAAYYEHEARRMRYQTLSRGARSVAASLRRAAATLFGAAPQQAIDR